MQYSSIHSYLDAVFSDIDNPSKEDIISAKKIYWKKWRVAYNKKRRSTHASFTLSFNTTMMQKINAKRGQQSVSVFLYQSVKNALYSNGRSSKYDSLLAECHQKVMQVTMLVEELFDSHPCRKTEHILEQLEFLEIGFSELRKG